MDTPAVSPRRSSLTLTKPHIYFCASLKGKGCWAYNLPVLRYPRQEECAWRYLIALNRAMRYSKHPVFPPKF